MERYGMSLTRREFGLATLGFGATVAAGGRACAQDALIGRAIPASGEEIPIIGVGTNRYGVGNDAAAREPLRASLRRFHFDAL
jgi:hypothetical protein